MSEERPPTPAEENRRAVIPLWPQQIARVLDLPEDVWVTGVYASNDPYGIVIVVEGPNLEAQPEGVTLPILGGTWTIEQSFIDDKLYVRWGWMPA